MAKLASKLRSALLEHDREHMRIVGDQRALSRFTWKVAGAFFFGAGGGITALFEPWLGWPIAAVGVAFFISLPFDPAFKRMAEEAETRGLPK